MHNDLFVHMGMSLALLAGITCTPNAFNNHPIYYQKILMKLQSIDLVYPSIVLVTVRMIPKLKNNPFSLFFMLKLVVKPLICTSRYYILCFYNWQRRPSWKSHRSRHTSSFLCKMHRGSQFNH